MQVWCPAGRLPPRSGGIPRLGLRRLRGRVGVAPDSAGSWSQALQWPLIDELARVLTASLQPQATHPLGSYLQVQTWTCACYGAI